MRKTALLFTVLTVLFIACGEDSVSTQAPAKSDTPPRVVWASDVDDCIKWDFRFLITLDHQMSSAIRKIEVFMEADAFNEANLQRLFRHLSDKNPDAADSARNLHISVVTDWKQLGLPTDCPPSGSSGSNTVNPTVYQWARFYRRGEKEFFTFNPEKTSDKAKDVIMKGTEIFRNGVWQPPF